jgi:hypothetical protein
MPRFESFLPSQPVRSLRFDFQAWENRRHSRGSGLTRLENEEALSSEVRRRRIQSCKSWLRLVELMRSHVANLEADEHYPEDDDDEVTIRLAEVRCTNGDLPTGTRS